MAVLDLLINTRFGNPITLYIYIFTNKYLKVFLAPYSFWNRHIDSWNALLNNVVDADNVNKFKDLLYKYLNAC